MSRLVTDHLPLLAGAPNGVKKLRELILELATSGRLLEADADWRQTQLRELVTSSGAGWSPSCETRPRTGDEWGVLKVSAVSWSQFRPEENKALPPHLEPRPELEVCPGDFLISRANTAELVARSVVVENTPPRLILSDKIVRLRLSGACDPRFIQLVNSAPKSRSYYARVAGGTSSSMKNVSREQILALPVLLPLLAEQHHIVAKVDELMALCDLLETRQSDAQAAHARLVDELLGSLLQARDAEDFAAGWERLAGCFENTFSTEESIDHLRQVLLQLGITGKLIKPKGSWNQATLGNLGTVLGGATPSKSNPDYWLGDIPWVSPKDMKRTLIEDAEDHINIKAIESSPLKLIPAGSLLMVVRGMILAHSFPVAMTARDVTINQDMKALSVPKDLAPYLLLYLQASKNTIVALVDRSSHGTCKLVSEKLWGLKVDLPPLEEQKQIIAKFDELLALCDRLKACIRQARQMQERLAGALVERAMS